MTGSESSLLWAASDVPVGGGSNTNASVTANATGTQAIGNVSLNLTNGFDNPTDVYVSEVSVAPNSYPTNFNSSVGNKYFIIDAFPYPDSGSFSATLTLSYGAGVLTDAVASNYILYKRGSSSSGDWVSYGTASSVNTSTGEVTWTNIASFSQAIVVNQNSALPVEMNSFSASLSNGIVKLQWGTATEVNNYGFNVERSEKKSVQNTSWQKVGFVEGNGTTNSPKEYRFIDKVQKAGTYSYRLKQIDRDGKFSYSQAVEVNVAAVPLVFALEQNYPNPFNPSTVISYQLPTNNHVTLKVYDVIGREVATLVNEVKEAGYYSATFDGSKLSSGMYFARLQSGDNIQLKKMLLLK